MMNDKKAYAIFKILKLKGVGPVLTNKIINSFSNPTQELFNIANHNVEVESFNASLTSEQVKLLNEPDRALINQIEQLKTLNGNFITIIDENYPRSLIVSLKNAAPPILTYFGNLNLLQMSAVGFCGSRKASTRGLEVAQDCATQLAKKEVAIISGHAAGVDEQTHYAALQAGGCTIIVIPEGLLNFKIRRSLKDVWDNERVLIISEYLPDAKWSVSRAMQRNKTIIALSEAMVLIEAGENGGSMDAGKRTLAMRKKLYAPIYEGMPDFAKGNQILLKQGALPLRKSKSEGKASLTNLINTLNIAHQTLSGKQLSLI